MKVAVVLFEEGHISTHLDEHTDMTAEPCRDTSFPWVCTRTRVHTGQHEAGVGGGEIAAAWPNEGDEA